MKDTKNKNTQIRKEFSPCLRRTKSEDNTGKLLFYIVSIGMSAAAFHDPVFILQVIRRTTSRALQHMHGIEAGRTGLTVYGVNGEAEILLRGETLDQRHVEVFLFLHDLAVDEIGIKHIEPDQQHEDVAILDPGVQILHGATVVDVDDVIKSRKIRIASVDTHIGAVLGENDGTEQ